MVAHMVLFKIRNGIADERIKAMTDALEALREEIPQLAEIHAGVNLSDRNKGYHVMLISRFKNTRDLKTYIDHPAHKRVVEEFIQPIREDVIVGDLSY
jgi:hypothetical protein